MCAWISPDCSRRATRRLTCEAEGHPFAERGVGECGVALELFEESNVDAVDFHADNFRTLPVGRNKCAQVEHLATHIALKVHLVRQYDACANQRTPFAMKITSKSLLAVACVAMFAAPVLADITVGVTLSATGPAASLGIPEKNTFALLPTTIAGQKINYIILDDASDTTTAVKNARKLMSENKVDVILGSTITPNSLAMIDVAAESQTPMISMAASARIVEPMDAEARWVFKTPQNDTMMATASSTT